MTTERPRFVLDGHDLARFLALFWLVMIVTYLGLILVRDLEEPDRLILRDYYCFHRAGELWLEGGTGYEQLDRTFANPPFVLPLAGAISRLGPTGSFFASDVLCLLGVIVGMLAIGRIGGSDPRFRLTALSAGLACPSLVFALHLGQWTGLYVGLAGLVVYGWCEREETLAGVAAGLLWSKPPLAIALIAVGTVTRPARFSTAWLATLAGLLGLGLALGGEVWTGFRASMASLVERHESTPDSWRKQLTLYAFIRTLAARGAEDPAHGRELARALSMITAASLGGWGALVRWRARASWPRAATDRALSMRLGSIAILATVSLNLYLFYYDAALVVLPTIFLFSNRTAWGSGARWWVAVLLAVASWIAQLLPMLWTGGPNPVGPLCAAWLILELAELHVTLLRKPAI